jgi:hypothetical protein
MNSVLSIICIAFFAYLTHYIIKGYNQMKEYSVPCKTLYIPEDFDLNVALDTVVGLSRNKLERRALELGIKRSVIKDKNDTDLKILIIQKSIEDKHIMTMEIEEKIKEREKQRLILRELSNNEDIDINSEQIAQLNPNVTIDALRDDLDN